MTPNALFATLPDFSARIMHHTLTSELNVDWDIFCRDNRLKPVRLDGGASELLAQDELLLQQGFVALTSNHPDLWFSVGLRYRSIKYGALGMAMMTARTLAESLEIACRYQALTYSLINYRFVCASNGACTLIGEVDRLPAHLHDFSHHRDLGAVRTLVADLMAGDAVLERVTVAAPPPCNWNAIKSNFPCPVAFDADRTQWIFVPGAASRQLPLGDHELQILYSSRCDRLLGTAQADACVTQRLTVLLSARGGDFPSAGEAAKQLSLSERTLHRRLAEEGTRFSTIIDEARYRRERELLADRRLTIEAIACAVGFADASSFSEPHPILWTAMTLVASRRSSCPRRKTGTRKSSNAKQCA